MYFIFILRRIFAAIIPYLDVKFLFSFLWYIPEAFIQLILTTVVGARCLANLFQRVTI